jgi:hypothetical protein
MREPARRIGREIGILAEDVLRAHIFPELDKEALAADQHTERKMRLHLIELLGGDDGLTQRRGAEIDEDMLEMAAAEAAPGCVSELSPMCCVNNVGWWIDQLDIHPNLHGRRLRPVRYQETANAAGANWGQAPLHQIVRFVSCLISLSTAQRCCLPERSVATK